MKYKIKLDLKILPTLGKIVLAWLILIVIGAVIGVIILLSLNLMEHKELVIEGLAAIVKFVTMILFLKIVLENITIVRTEDSPEINLLLTEILKEIKELKNDNKIEN